MYHKFSFPPSPASGAVCRPPPFSSFNLLLEPEPILVMSLRPEKPQAAVPDGGHAQDEGHGGGRFKISSVLSNFNPKKVFWDRPRENLKAFRDARSIRDEHIASDPQLVRAKVETKLLGALAASEVAGTCIGAPSIGVAFQEWFHNSYMGVVGTVIGDYLPAVLGFQVAWGALNAGFYSSRSGSFLGRVREFYRDVGPVHAAAAIASLPAYAVGAALSSGVIAILNRIGEHLAEKVKLMPLVSELINFGVVETIYLSLIAGSTMIIGDRIAARYTSYLQGKYGIDEDGGLPGGKGK